MVYDYFSEIDYFFVWCFACDDVSEYNVTFDPNRAGLTINSEQTHFVLCRQNVFAEMRSFMVVFITYTISDMTAIHY